MPCWKASSSESAWPPSALSAASIDASLSETAIQSSTLRVTNGSSGSSCWMRSISFSASSTSSGRRRRLGGRRLRERLVSVLPGDVAAALDFLLQLGQPLLAVREPEDELLDLLPLVGLGIAVEIGVDEGAGLQELRAG